MTATSRYATKTWHGYHAVLFVNTYPSKPIFHLPDGLRYDTLGKSYDATLCGKHGTDWLAFEHAQKFGRKCSLCEKKASRNGF